LDQDLLELFDHAIGVLEELQIPYAIGGSVATLAYGEVRGTRDLDVVILLDDADIPKLLAGFPFPDFYSDLQAARDALRTGGTFNVIYGRAKVDFFAAKGFVELNQVQRAKRLRTVDGRLAQVSSPEELIAKKLEYYDQGGSDKHLRDITVMLQSSTVEIERERVADYARRLRLSELWGMVMRRADETNPE
jgi:predicted nucleotidyltransferase